MRSSNMKAEVINAMQILEIEDLNSVPLMKTVKKKFLRLVKAKHPDGGIGSAADFVELLEAKEYLMHHIKTNNPQEDEKDEEEELSRKEFESANIIKVNEDSITVSIPTEHVKFWREVLEEKLIGNLVFS